MFKKKIDVGVVVCDMHGTTLTTHPDLNENFEVRNVVMFHLHTDHTQKVGHFYQFLNGISRGYSNKCLVVLDYPWNCPIEEDEQDAWWPCAFSYDSNYAGVCEIRWKKED